MIRSVNAGYRTNTRISSSGRREFMTAAHFNHLLLDMRVETQIYDAQHKTQTRLMGLEIALNSTRHGSLANAEQCKTHRSPINTD